MKQIFALDSDFKIILYSFLWMIKVRTVLSEPKITPYDSRDCAYDCPKHAFSQSVAFATVAAHLSQNMHAFATVVTEFTLKYN